MYPKPGRQFWNSSPRSYSPSVIRPSEITAILLAGGLGTRVRPLYPDIPKPLIPVAGRPFIEWSIRYWIRQGLRKFVLSAGYRVEEVSRFVKDRPNGSISIKVETESEPL